MDQADESPGLMVWKRSCACSALDSYFYLKRDSLEAHPTQQIVEARIIVQVIEDRFNFELDKIRVALIESLFKPGESLLLLSEQGINLSHAIWRHVMLC